jgi:hypothetical protein
MMNHPNLPPRDFVARVGLKRLFQCQRWVLEQSGSAVSPSLSVGSHRRPRLRDIAAFLVVKNSRRVLRKAGGYARNPGSRAEGIKREPGRVRPENREAAAHTRILTCRM